MKRKFSGSLTWLYDTGIINFCNNINPPELPFAGNIIPSSFKVYMNDIGLLCAMLDDGTQKDIIDDTLKIYKGAIYENLIADIFTKSGNRGTTSMSNLLKSGKFDLGIKLCNGNIGFAEKKLTLPLHCAVFL